MVLQQPPSSSLLDTMVQTWETVVNGGPFFLGLLGMCIVAIIATLVAVLVTIRAYRQSREIEEAVFDDFDALFDDDDDDEPVGFTTPGIQL